MGAEAGGASVKRWAWGHAAASLGLEIGRRGNHRAVATFPFSFPYPTPGRIARRSKQATTSKLQEQPEIAAREDPSDPALRRAPGATARRQRGVFPSGFPPYVEDLGPPHRLTVIEPTAGGAASVAAAQPQIETAGGGRSYGIRRGRPREYEYGYGMLCTRTSFGVGKPTVDAL